MRFSFPSYQDIFLQASIACCFLLNLMLYFLGHHQIRTASLSYELNRLCVTNSSSLISIFYWIRSCWMVLDRYNSKTLLILKVIILAFFTRSSSTSQPRTFSKKEQHLKDLNYTRTNCYKPSWVWLLIGMPIARSHRRSYRSHGKDQRLIDEANLVESSSSSWFPIRSGFCFCCYFPISSCVHSSNCKDSWTWTH